MAVTFFNCAKVQITIDRYKCNSKFNSTFNPGCHLDYSGRNGSGEVAFDRGTKVDWRHTRLRIGFALELNGGFFC